MKKQRIWRLVLNDLLSVLTAFWVLFRWDAKDDFTKFGGVVLLVYLVIVSVDAHYQHYKKEKRWY